MRKKDKNPITWLQVVIIFLLGILIATNVFMFLNLQDKQIELGKIHSEINKLKADDVALAQALNNLITQLQTAKIIAPPPVLERT